MTHRGYNKVGAQINKHPEYSYTACKEQFAVGVNHFNLLSKLCLFRFVFTYEYKYKGKSYIKTILKQILNIEII